MNKHNSLAEAPLAHDTATGPAIARITLPRSRKAAKAAGQPYYVLNAATICGHRLSLRRTWDAKCLECLGLKQPEMAAYKAAAAARAAKKAAAANGSGAANQTAAKKRTGAKADAPASETAGQHAWPPQSSVAEAATPS